jgi:hypothetical protein
LQEGFQDSFCVGVGSETVAKRLKLFPQLEVIVDFAIKDNSPLAPVFQNGLIAALEVDDFQTCGTEGKGWRGENALLIGPAVMQSR